MERDELLDKYRYILRVNGHMADLKGQIEAKKRECQAIMSKEQECREEPGTGTIIKCLIPALLFILVGIATIVSIFDSIMRSAIPAEILMLVFLAGLYFLVYTLSFARNDRDKNEIEAARIHNNELIPAYQEYMHRVIQLQEIENTTEIEEIESELPEDYRTQDAVRFFIKALETRRADTEKEVFNLYEEELHRRRLEQIEEEKLDQLEQIEASLTHCPNCGSTNCQMIMRTKTQSTPFAFGDACCGWILLGPIGLLCGICGAGTNTETENYWICNSCGKKFTY